MQLRGGRGGRDEGGRCRGKQDSPSQVELNQKIIQLKRYHLFILLKGVLKLILFTNYGLITQKYIKTI